MWCNPTRDYVPTCIIAMCAARRAQFVIIKMIISRTDGRAHNCARLPPHINSARALTTLMRKPERCAYTSVHFHLTRVRVLCTHSCANTHGRSRGGHTHMLPSPRFVMKGRTINMHMHTHAKQRESVRCSARTQRYAVNVCVSAACARTRADKHETNCAPPLMCV